ncbi:MAG TPA: hypothetical protein VF666_04685 [Pyrinomonadaceae bacterium]|jgi:hypothetical protein
MRNFAKLFLTIALLIVCAAAPSLAQRKRACPVPPPSPFKHNASIVTSFDRASRGMRTTLEHPRVLARNDGELYLLASFIHQDPRMPLNRLKVDIVFYSTSTHVKYRDAHDLVFMTDGRQFPFAGTSAQYRSERSGGQIVESTRVSVPYDVLLNLINSKKVAARVGATEFEFSHNHLEALRELASLITPASQGSWSNVKVSER